MQPIELPNCGHLIPLEEPELFADYIIEFTKNPNLVFLDTAASALKVDEMIEATNNCYANEYANISNV